MKELKFSHITRTSGTSLETCAKNQQAIDWCRFHKEYGYWHTPLSEIDSQIQHKYDWFIIVRNPYDRVISEFYFGGISPYQKNVSCDLFNSIIRLNILNQNKKEFHYEQQYKYLTKLSVAHVIKYENLEQELYAVLNMYSINIKHDIRDKVSKPKKFNIEHLEKETINIINDFYQKDFSLFNYSMIG